jgi:hypothetical protein
MDPRQRKRRLWALGGGFLAVGIIFDAGHAFLNPPRRSMPDPAAMERAMKQQREEAVEGFAKRFPVGVRDVPRAQVPDDDARISARIAQISRRTKGSMKAINREEAAFLKGMYYRKLMRDGH